jgi:hypothetical protein
MEQLKDMLLTYNEYNRELGYVQGMSDLLAPIYAVMQDDAVAFWGFQHFMDRMERNFLRDQSGMRKQLLTLDHLVQLMDPKLYLHLQSADSTNFFFFFRMLLVWYKREFQWPDVLHLWEVLWTDLLSSNFHLFVALAILEKHRSVIMDHLKHFDEVLKYGKHAFRPYAHIPRVERKLINEIVNELSNSIDLESTLIRAEALFRRFQRMVEAIDKKSNFPAPKLRQRLSTRNPSASSVNSAQSPPPPITPSSPSSTTPKANTSGTDTVSVGVTNSGVPNPSGGTGGAPKAVDKWKGNKKDDEEVGESAAEATKGRVISPELRGLLSTKVEVLPRKVVRKEGEGRSSLGR